MSKLSERLASGEGLTDQTIDAARALETQLADLQALYADNLAALDAVTAERDQWRTACIETGTQLAAALQRENELRRAAYELCTELAKLTGGAS